MKRALTIIGGLTALLAGGCASLFLLQYVTGEIWPGYSMPLLTDTSILIGLAHVIGFSAIAVMGFALGICWLAEGCVSPPQKGNALMARSLGRNEGNDPGS